METNVLTLECFQRPDGSPLGPGFIGLGNTAIVLQEGRNALKIPKLRNLDSAPASHQQNLLFNNEMNQEKIRNEIRIFQRLGSHPGIIKCIKASENGIELPLFKRGSLCSYIRQQENRPPQSVMAKWIQSIADILCHCHERRVLLADIALRNILIDDDDSLVLIDFAESTALPLDTNMDGANDGDVTVQTEIFHFSFIALSILTWHESEYDLYTAPPDDERCGVSFAINWPRLESLPHTTNIPFGQIIRKCWIQGAYRNMHEVRDDISRIIEEEGRKTPLRLGATSEDLSSRVVK